jgi:hypothetical protein
MRCFLCNPCRGCIARSSWVPAGADARCERAGWLPAVSFCSALLYESPEIGRNLLYWARTDRGLVYIVYVFNNMWHMLNVKIVHTDNWPNTADWLTNDKPVLSSERAPSQGQDSNCQTVRHQDRQSDWPSVAMWLWLWLWLRLLGMQWDE